MANYVGMTEAEFAAAAGMTAAEIEAVKAEIKHGIIAAKADAHRLEHEFRRPKHMTELAAQALKNAGVEGVLVTPEPAALAANTNDAGVNE